MWGSISIIISILASIFIAIVFWKMQNNNANLKANLIKKILVSALSGGIFGVILYAALNPNQTIIPTSFKFSIDLLTSQDKAKDTDHFKNANGSLRFFSDEACDN